MSRMSFRHGAGPSGYPVGKESDPKAWKAEQMRDAIMSRSTRRLAGKLNDVQKSTGDTYDYKLHAAAKGAETGAVATLLIPPKAAKESSVKTMAVWQEPGAGHPSVPDVITSVWGPPSMGAAYAQLPRGTSTAGPLEQRRALKEASYGTLPAGRAAAVPGSVVYEPSASEVSPEPALKENPRGRVGFVGPG